MVDSREFVTSRIPHRPPFLWVDRVIRCDGESLEAEKDIPADLDLFAGHYPHHPIMPGVLLCEAVFQAGAILISEILAGREASRDAAVPAGVPVLTRIRNARFKREVGPGDTIVLQVKLSEELGPAWFMKGKVLLGGKTAVKVEFACTLAGGEDGG